MRRWSLWLFVGMVGLSGCKEPVPFFCDEDTPCTDPERPYCDLEGEFPASEGHGNTCIPDPFPDAGGIDAKVGCSASNPCTSPEASRCEDSSGACLPCEGHTDCSHLDGFELCVSDTCVACELAPLTAGGSSSCGVRTDGSLFCWGDNSFSQLGLSGDPIREPTALEAGSDWVQIALGGFHACGVRDDGSLWCWGRNDAGQAGQLGGGGVSAPTQVGGDADWARVALGSHFSCGLREDGSLWCWGGNFAGQLGLGDSDHEPHPSPERIGSATGWDTIAAGGNHGCGVRGGSLYCWGANNAGQTGQSGSGPFAPTRVGSRADWNAVAAGSVHSCAIRNGTVLECWGADFDGQLGDGTPDQDAHPNPTEVQAGVDWIDLGLGSDHTCAIRENGSLWCWGRNDRGQPGQGESGDDVAAPVQVGSDLDWASVTAGSLHTCGVRDDGSLWCWGANNDGQLGQGESGDDVLAPVEVACPTP